MNNIPNQTIDPSKIFVQANCFYQALTILRDINPKNTQLVVDIGEPFIVVAALTIELFLKCLLCIEKGEVPRGHHLRFLFDNLSPSMRSRIRRAWDNSIAPDLAEVWNLHEKEFGIKIARDLPAALCAGGNAFERIRYSYEGKTKYLQFYLLDIPQHLRSIILELKPEWSALRRNYL
ncbi:conserved hypothetical protein [Methylocella tundrae]|uniref:HEPN domain-containing protein n=1 Tax=Methylocella tundrae TaxID=227605 RepID=A0A8B6M9C7_METTU|nr:hypothetical protein [Methylocella tundrae]VTZ21664.1 conserved hypothetical protein [Methylocella tundrae]VTZ51623.1 conserved hypothetical protein [Methylocella tundrae]